MNTTPHAALVGALTRIEKWFGEFPDTGRTWDDGTPMSYVAAFGSNGEREYMRAIAREALERAALAQAEAAQPVAWVDERAIQWLADRKNRAGAHITTKLEPARSFERPMPLYAAPQPAEAAPQTPAPGAEGGV